MTIDKFGHKLKSGLTSLPKYRTSIIIHGYIDPAIDDTHFIFTPNEHFLPIHLNGVVEEISIDPKDVTIWVKHDKKTSSFSVDKFLGVKLHVGDKLFFRCDKKGPDKLLCIITLKCTTE